MKGLFDLLLVWMSRFAGGPGPKEDNLLRFSLPAVVWFVLFIIAWTRQRQHELPREKLLVWGFGLGLARELFMLSHVAMQLMDTSGQTQDSLFVEPLEHALTLAAIVMVGGAFLRYILDDTAVARRYLAVGLTATGVCYVATSWWWAQHAALHSGSRFNQTWGGVLFHGATSVLSIVAIGLLFRKRGWLRNVVTLALFFFFLSGFLKIVNFAAQRAFADVICPFANGFHILAVPLLGYVYLREQAIEKQQAQEELAAYRDHLEELVEDRTIELTRINEQLQCEIVERERAETEIARRNSELAAQNAIAATISQSLDLETILHTALDMVLGVLGMEVGSIYLLGSDGESLRLRVHRGRMSTEQLAEQARQECPCGGICKRAVQEMKPFVLDVTTLPSERRSVFMVAEGLQTLVTAPLLSKGRAVGALTLGARRPDAISALQLELLNGIAQQIGIAVDNARLYHETERWVEELALLHEVSVFLTSTLDAVTIYDQITEQTAKLLGCQMTAIFLWDGQAQQAVGMSGYGMDGQSVDGRRMSLGECGLLDDLMLHRRFVIVEDVAQEPVLLNSWIGDFGVRALLGLPLWGKETPLGFLFVMEAGQPRKWQLDELELIESFINLAAIALENAQLHAQVEKAAVLEERHRIAADMHDGLAQTLSYMGLRVDRAAELIQQQCHQDALSELHGLREAVGQASREVRRSIASLQANPKPRQPLQDRLSVIVNEFAMEGGPPITLASRLESPLFLPSSHVEQITRVVQEALTNARRHAQAENICISLEELDSTARIIIRDDGQGFDPASPLADGADHFGLSIMRARAARIGGQLHIDSAPGQGTQVVMTFSLDPDTLNRERDDMHRTFDEQTKQIER
ncbi:MAG: GAF domain-containing protein [Chloroflexota bacterium]